MRNLGATPEELAAMEASREGAANTLYGQAYASDAMRHDMAKLQPGASQIMNVPAQDLSTPALRELASRPLFQQAIKEAQTLARNMGENIGDPLTSVKGLHYIKMALDDGFKNPQSSLAAFGQRALSSTKNALVAEIEELAPSYAAARQTFAEMSKPIASAQVGNELFNRSTSAAENALGNVTLRSEALSRALRGGDKLAQGVTKFNKATLADTLGPEKMASLQAIRKDVSRSQAAQNVGRATGSPTAQNLAAQNILNRVAGPLGIPESFLANQATSIMAGALGLPFKLTRSQTEDLLVRALQDPRIAAKLMQTPDPKVWLELLRPYAAQLITQGALAGDK